MNRITLSQLESTLCEPIDIEFSYTQIPIYDSAFKEASLLLEKAENLRSSLTNPLKTLLNTCECETLIDGIETWVYSISAICQGRIAESGLRFETQNPYIKLNIEIKSESGVFFENLKQFFRVAFEARANLSEINQSLHIVGNRAENFFNTIRAETQKLELNSISTSIIRRNITQNTQKIASSFQKIKSLDHLFKSLEQDKTHFIQVCNNLILNADEIGLRGWYENRLCPKQFRELISSSPLLVVAKPAEGDLETSISERVERDKPISEYTTECKNEETKISEINNQFESVQVDFEESDYHNKSLRCAKEKETNESAEIGSSWGFPMMVPFNCLNMNSNEVIGASSRGKVIEAYFMNRRCAVKCVKPEETQIMTFLTEINNMSLLKDYNFVNYLAFSLVKEPLSLYLIYQPYPYDLHDLLFRRKKSLKFNEKIDICLEILKALDVLNKMEMCHGNLTLRNILLDLNFRAFIADYVLGKNSKKCFSKYDSFEFLKDGKYRKEQDIYSFGIIFYEIISEREAWMGLREEEIITEKKKLNFFGKNNRIGKEIDDIIERCINFEEDERLKPQELLMIINKLRKF